jgi:hypothetical protein
MMAMMRVKKSRMTPGARAPTASRTRERPPDRPRIAIKLTSTMPSAQRRNSRM